MVTVCVVWRCGAVACQVPVALTVAFLTNREEIELGLDYLQITELALTLVTCMLTFGTGTTNYLQVC
jgi:Ca2+/H+ antiporter